MCHFLQTVLCRSKACVGWHRDHHLQAYIYTEATLWMLTPAMTEMAECATGLNTVYCMKHEGVNDANDITSQASGVQVSARNSPP